MNNSKRSIIFFISFMVVMCIFSFIVPRLPINYENELGDIIFINLLYFLFLLLLPLLQMGLRFLYTSKDYIKENVFFSIPLTKKNIYNRLVYYIIAIFIFLIPVITSRDINTLGISELISFGYWMLIIEVILRVSNKNTKIYFMKNGILLRGYDMSIDIPLGNDLMNHSGFYYYTQFNLYDLNDNNFKLFMTGDLGHIIGELDDEKIEPVKAFLSTKHISQINK